MMNLVHQWAAVAACLLYVVGLCCIIDAMSRAPVLDDDDHDGFSDAELHDADLMEGVDVMSLTDAIRRMREMYAHYDALAARRHAERMQGMERLLRAPNIVHSRATDTIPAGPIGTARYQPESNGLASDQDLEKSVHYGERI